MHILIYIYMYIYIHTFICYIYLLNIRYQTFVLDMYKLCNKCIHVYEFIYKTYEASVSIVGALSNKI